MVNTIILKSQYHCIIINIKDLLMKVAIKLLT